MAFFAGLLRWHGWNLAPANSQEDRSAAQSRAGQSDPVGGQPDREKKTTSVTSTDGRVCAHTRSQRRPQLYATRSAKPRKDAVRLRSDVLEVSGAAPYRYARFGSGTGRHLDLSQDGKEGRLRQRGLPIFHTPEELAEWLGLPLKKVAWLVHRFTDGRPASLDQAHYHFSWRKKNAGGWRLIESPKQTLKYAQNKILREILDHVPAHAAAHGFVCGKSILTNARPHVGQATLLKLDLANFYATVGFSRVTALFRSLGYSREAGIWLALLTTSAIPGNMAFPGQDPYAFDPYLRRHLPQGASTSPVLANLSAYRLDIRLAGLSKSFGASYTRYADDLAISGPAEFAHGLRLFIPLVQQIIRQERFRSNHSKRRVLRANQRQSIAGVVVNERINIAREHFDRLKAILTNCVREGPSTQNRENVADLKSHLRGRVAHVQQLNPTRGENLLRLFNRIDWSH